MKDLIKFFGIFIFIIKNKDANGEILFKVYKNITQNKIIPWELIL